MRILLTGATGFVGLHLYNFLNVNSSYSVIPVVRKCISNNVFNNPCVVPDISADTDWASHLNLVDGVIHSAACVYSSKFNHADQLHEFRRINVDGTLNLARQAASSGVKRFIFISSIKVNGEQTPIRQPFTADSPPAPVDAYGISKWEAEQGLQQLANDKGMEVVIIRPPLVYGPGVKGNFASIIKLVKKRLPLPLGAICNQRTLVSVDNLVNLIVTCLDHPAAANQVFLAGDGHDLSTTGLLRGVALAMDKPSMLIPVPSSLLMLAATLFGKKAVAQRLLGSLQVDISKARDLLGWEPPITVEEGLRRCFHDQVK